MGRLTTWAAMALCAALPLGTAWAQDQQVKPAPAEIPEPRAVVPDFTGLARTLQPAVVNISAEVRPPRGPQATPQLPPPFDRFFEGQPEGRPRRGIALGSGFIVDPSGLVVTNNHVIEDAQKISVVLSDERELPAKVVGRDDRTDVALLKVESDKPLPHVPWGDSETAQVGEWVLAIGNPFGLGGSVTSGIISATARDIGAGPYDAFLQTDAAINQGNSGGPLFNMRGQVIGINTAIFSPTGGSIGIGFAVPSALARPIIDQLKVAGVVKRGWLGVAIQPVSPEIARSLGLDKPQGALVAEVTDGGPAQKAGLRSGDVILSFNHQPIDQAHGLPRMVADTKIGSKADVELFRQGKRQTVTATIGELPNEDEKPVAARPSPEPAEGALGLALLPLNEQTRSQLGVPPEVEGVLVRGVAEGSPASEAGLAPGMVISQIDQQPVTRPDQVRKIVADARDKGRESVLLQVRTGQGNRFVPVDLAPQIGEIAPDQPQPEDESLFRRFHGPGAPGGQGFGQRFHDAHPLPFGSPPRTQ